MGQLFDLEQDLPIERLRKEIDVVLELMQMNRSLGELMPMANQDFTRPLEKVADCYEAEIVDNRNQSTTFLNIFDKNIRFSDIVKSFYQAFPENDISVDSIRALLSSTHEIITKCMTMENYHSDFNPDQTTKLGYTELSDKNEGYMRNMMGVTTDENSAPTSPFYNRLHNNMMKPSAMLTAMDGSSSQCIRKSRRLPNSFDWREKNAVTSVKNQGQCGSCWAFATVGSIESAYVIHNNVNKDQIDLSEQEIVSCARSRGCQGGASVISFDFVRRYGLTSERNMPYQARDGNGCRRAPPPVAKIRNYCVRSKIRYSNSLSTEYLKDDDIRNALVAFGPLYVAVNADRLSKNYRGGIINDRSCSTQVNHAILLVGYTSRAWILKNSWGSSWGERGYFRLARGQNMCGINTEIAYPIV
ncbi:Group 1 mite allergen-like protein (Cysteine protease) [Euroglyphus maynei]|uniref:Group 1 mite allergen-like protein (Cysteine protease) n=1 Tax=Euroglyphus maynei TaxID=6958 RepID=A0A1Y3AZJ9_EURMA|nr:Group 1 mite allergen-like protein (Cysteine protease) [Euroglyphus maynei]